MSRTTRWRRFLAALTVAVGTALAMVACGGEQPANDGQGDILKVGLARGAPADLMTYVADKEGFFAKRGLNVDLVTMDNANSLATALISDDLDVDTMVPPLLWPALDKGACVKAMGGTIGNSMDIIAQPDIEVTGDPTNPDTTLSALKGKSIGVIARGSGTELWTAALLEHAGLDPAKDVTFVAVGAPSTAVEAFKAKKVDAMYYGPTMEEQLPLSDVTRVTDIVGRTGNVLSPLVQAYYTASCQALDNRPKDMSNYCKAIWDAYSFSQDAKNNDVMGRHLSDLIGVSAAGGAQSWAKLKSAYRAPTMEKAVWDVQAPLVASPAPAVPDFASSTYEPCAQGDPR